MIELYAVCRFRFCRWRRGFLAVGLSAVVLGISLSAPSFCRLGLASSGVTTAFIGYSSGLVACYALNRALFGVAGFMYMAPFTTGGFAPYGLFGYPSWLPTYVLDVAPTFLRISKTALSLSRPA